jgi:hypothetical protein
VVTVVGFIFTWTPYAVTLFVSAFRGKDAAIPPMATFICACFAKSSVMWMPILYISTSTHFKLHFVDMSAIDKQGGNTSTAGGAPNPSVAVRKNEKTAAIPAISAAVEKDFSPIDEQ